MNIEESKIENPRKCVCEMLSRYRYHKKHGVNERFIVALVLGTMLAKLIPRGEETPRNVSSYGALHVLGHKIQLTSWKRRINARCLR